MICPDCKRKMVDLSADLYLCQCGCKMEQLRIGGIGMETKNCIECGRKLKSAKSIYAGIGPTCSKKREKRNKELLKKRLQEANDSIDAMRFGVLYAK